MRKIKIVGIVFVALLVLGAVTDSGGDEAPKTTPSRVITYTMPPASSTASSRSLAPDQTTAPPVEIAYVINKSSGVVHVAGCRYEKQMKEGNRLEITCTREEMLTRGLNPCDTCRP